MKFKNVIFDLYGTLVDIRTDEHGEKCWERTAEVFLENGAEYSPKELEKRYFGAVNELEAEAKSRAEYEYPEIDISRVFRLLYREKGVSASDELSEKTAWEFRRASTKFIRLYPNVKRLLSGLREEGARVFLLSNAQAVFTRREIAELGLGGLFDRVCLSSEFGVKKPDQRFFEVLLNGLERSETAMVGNDMACDIEPAKKLGLATVYVRSAISPKGDRPRADLVVKSSEIMRVRDYLTKQ